MSEYLSESEYFTLLEEDAEDDMIEEKHSGTVTERHNHFVMSNKENGGFLSPSW